MMIFRMSPTSPYARKVRAVIVEKGLADQVEAVPTDPHASPAELLAKNPLSKIPVLELGDGTALFDSPVICEYLDALTETPRLVPAAGSARWRALRLQAVGDGIMDAGVLRLMEKRWHPGEGQVSQGWLDRQRAAIARCADLLEAEADTLETQAPTLGELTVACALGYVDFRFGDDAWRTGRPRLAAWFERFAARPSIAETAPPADAPPPGG